MHQRKRFVSFLLVVSILLSTLYLPVGATQTAALTETSSTVSSVSEDVMAAAELLAGVPVDFEKEAILQHVDQDAFRASNHVRRLPEEETLDTFVYLNQDGTKSVYFMEENVKYVDSAGKVQNKDISLKETKNGFTTAQNDVSVFIPMNAANGIQVSHTIGNLKLIPESSLIVVAGKQDGNSILYANYFGKGMSLRYTPLLSGVKEDIILASYTGKHSFQFALDTNGLFVYEDAEEGYYVAASQSAEDRYYLGEILVYDAIGRPSMGTMTVRTVTAGARYVLTVAADPAFLTDADTIYPVTIDPTITLDSTNGTTKQIWDVPIFSGYPTWTCGAYQYLTLGNAGGNYGTGRAIIKLPGLYESDVFQNTPASDIFSVNFYCSDGSGNASQYISLRAHMGSTTWTESNASWNSVGSAYETSYDWGTTVAHGVWTNFNITELAQIWKTNVYIPAAGFQLIHSDEATREKHKAIHATEYATASYRPYVTMTYRPQISLDVSNLELMIGDQYTLTATVSDGLPVRWISTNPNVISVDSDGRITAIHAGQADIIALVTDNMDFDGAAVCHIVSYLPDDICTIQNKNSGLYLYATGILEQSVVIQRSSVQDSEWPYQLRQRWRICHIGNGLYSIRPTHRNIMGLSVVSSLACITDIGYLDSLEQIQANRWTIEWNDGYILKENGDTNKTLQAFGTTATVGVGAFDESNESKWIFVSKTDTPSGEVLYDATTQLPVSSNKVFYLTPGETKTLDDFGLIPARYGNDISYLSVGWRVEDEDKCVRYENLRDYIGIKPGINTIRGSYGLTGNKKYFYFTIKVLDVSNGAFFIRNRNSGQYLQIDNDAAPSYTASGAIMEQFPFANGDYQLWNVESLDNGYYKIVSAKSGLALSVNANQSLTEDIALVQTTYNGSFLQQWKITLTPNGSYKVKARSAESHSVDLVMASGAGILVDGINVQQREYLDNDSFKDEWYFNLKSIAVQPEKQEKKLWCWVACARMLCTRYMIPNISQASAAVYVKLGIDTQYPTEAQKANANLTGSQEDVMDAIQYLIGYDQCYAHENKIYSESVLKSLLNAKTPVIVSLDKVGDSSGHSVVVYGTMEDTINNQTIYLVYDPWDENPSKSYWTYDFLCDNTKGTFYTYQVSKNKIINVNFLYDEAHYVWSGVVTFKTGAYNQVINNPYS